MAKKPAAKPSGRQERVRLSPGVYRNVPSTGGKGLLSKPKPQGKGKGDGKANREKRQARQEKKTEKIQARQALQAERTQGAGLTEEQQNIRQQQGQFGEQVGGMLPGMGEEIQQNLQQPFSYEGQPSVFGYGGQDQQDVTGLRNSIIQSQMDEFDRQNAQNIETQRQDFDRQMAERGIPMGSDLYNKQKALQEQSFSNARNSAMANAQANAEQQTSGQFGRSLQARQQGIGEYGQQRYAPMQEAGMLQGLMSPAQGLSDAEREYQQQMGLQKEKGREALEQIRAVPRGGGGGGGAAGYTPWTPQQWSDYQQRLDINAQFAGTGPYAKGQQSNSSIWPAVGGMIGSIGYGMLG